MYQNCHIEGCNEDYSGDYPACPKCEGKYCFPNHVACRCDACKYERGLIIDPITGRLSTVNRLINRAPDDDDGERFIPMTAEEFAVSHEQMKSEATF